MAGREKYNLKSCLNSNTPQFIDNQCESCGKFYKTCVRALAEGDNICRICDPNKLNLKSHTGLISIHCELYKAHLDFYHAVWHWINNRTTELELKMNQRAGVLLFRLGKEGHIEDEISVEGADIKIQQTLFKAYINYKLELTPKSWKQLFYAFWQIEHFHKG